MHRFTITSTQNATSLIVKPTSPAARPPWPSGKISLHEISLILPLVRRSETSCHPTDSTGIPEPSHVLRAMGLDANKAAEVVRLSTAPTTLKDEIERALQCFAEVTDRMKVMA